MATEDDRSLKYGISIPQWVKKNIETRYDFDQTAFSPPSYDADFFHLKYKKEIETTSVDHKTDEVVTKHTTSCKEFIPYNKNELSNLQEKIIKPKGTDDGFHGEGAACGTSIIAVAQQVLSGKYKLNTNLRGFTTDDTTVDTGIPEKYVRQRRNSKSLPASPLTTPDSSPKLRRKHGTTNQPANRFFTGGPFVQTENTIQEEEKKKSWILTSLLSQQQQQQQEESRKLSKESSSGDESVVSDEHKQTTSSVHKKSKPKPKPSELREMNFWSPTSL